MAYKTASWGGCGRHLSLGMSSKVAIDGPFRNRTGENPPYGILEGEGETRSSIEPAGALSLLGSWEIREKSGVLQPIMPLDLPVKVRPWELTVYPRSHIRR